MLGVIDGALSVSGGARRAIDGAQNAIYRAQCEKDGLLKAIDGPLSVMSGAGCVRCGARSAIDGTRRVMCGAQCEKDGFPNAIDGALYESDGAWKAISSRRDRSLSHSSDTTPPHRLTLGTGVKDGRARMHCVWVIRTLRGSEGGSGRTLALH